MPRTTSTSHRAFFALSPTKKDVNLANQLIVITLSCCCAFQTIKFLQLLRFNNKIYMLALTLNHCLPNLGGFALVFSVVWFAYVQLMFLFFNEKSYAYADIVKAVTTSFQIMLGKNLQFGIYGTLKSR